MEAINYPFHFDEMSVAGKFLLESFSRDQALFQKKYPVFDDIFKNRFSRQVNRARDMVCCSAEGQKIQNIRDRIYRKMETVNVLILDLKESFPYTVPEAFKVMEQANEGMYLNRVIEAGRILYQKLEIPQKVLAGDENFISILDEFHGFLDMLELDRLELNRLLHSRGLLTEDIFRALNQLWATMQDVMEIGKEVHEFTNPEKKADYCLDNLRVRIRKYRQPMAEVEMD